MREAPDIANPDHHRLVGDLFTDIAVLEHLINNRYGSGGPHGLPARAFGVLNWFDRGARTTVRLAAIMYDFQWNEAETQKVIDLLAERGAVLRDGSEVSLTPRGRDMFTDQMVADVPEIAPLFEEMDMADVRVAVRVLADLRRTLDNLPDR